MSKQDQPATETQPNAATQMDKEFYLSAEHFGHSLYQSLAANDMASKQPSKWLD